MGIIVGEAIRKAVRGFAWRELDRVRVKGKDTAVTIFEPLGLRSQLDAAEVVSLSAWHGALAHYRAKRWTAAEAEMRNLARREPGRALYALYLERIARLRMEPPAADWDGVVAFDFK